MADNSKPGSTTGKPVGAAKAVPAAKRAKPVAAKPATAVVVAPEPALPVPIAASPAAPVSKPVEPAAKPVAEKPVPVPVPAAPAATPAPADLAVPRWAAPAAKETIMDTLNTTTDKAQAFFAEANDRTKTAFEKSQKLFDETVAFNKGNIEAMVESGKIAAKGLESLGQDAASYAKKSFEDATAAAKSLASVKSPTEFMKLQADFVRQSFDAMVAESARSTEAMLKLAGEVAQPISNRVALAAEKLKVAA